MTKEKESKIVSKTKKTKKEALINASKVFNTEKHISKVINPENYFFLHDGRVLKDLFELAENLENISDNIFYHHVNESKHDFANWIKDVFEDKDLAEEIYVIKDPKQIQLIILKHIAKNKRVKHD